MQTIPTEWTGHQPNDADKRELSDAENHDSVVELRVVLVLFLDLLHEAFARREMMYS